MLMSLMVALNGVIGIIAAVEAANEFSADRKGMGLLAAIVSLLNFAMVLYFLK
jgi:hypothetical protein